MVLVPRLYEPHSDTGMTLLHAALCYTPVDSCDSGMVPLTGPMYYAPVDGSDSSMLLLFGAPEYTPVGDNGFGIALAVLVLGNGALWCWYKSEDPDFGIVPEFGAR